MLGQKEVSCTLVRVRVSCYWADCVSPYAGGLDILAKPSLFFLVHVLQKPR